MHNMNKILLLIFFVFASSFSYAADESVYYAKCNLRVHGNKVSWDNWLADPVGIPAGTKIIFKREVALYEDTDGSTTTVVFTKATLDDGRGFKFPTDLSEKYLQKEPLILSTLPQKIQDASAKGEPANGMTKDHVITTLCAPAYVIKGMVTREVMNTEKLTLDEVKGFDLWVYKRKQIGKKFWVQFNEQGMVEKMYWGVL